MAHRKRKVLVTGGAGFIGSHLCEELLARGDEVTCLDNFSTGRRGNIEHLSSLRVIEANANSEAVWRKLLSEKFDILFHYAATVGVRRTEEEPMAVLADALGIWHTADFIRQGGARQAVFASSSEVYSQARQFPSSESLPVFGFSPYSTVKIYGEHVYRSLWQKYRVPTLSLRFFNVYGPRQAGNGYGFVVAKFLRQALTGQDLTVYGTGRQTRDFVYINDNIKVALAAAGSLRARGQVMNIGTGKETSVMDLAKIIISESGRQNLVRPVLVAGRPQEIRRRCADTRLMKRLAGVSCTTPLALGIKKIWQWYALEAAEKQAAEIAQPIKQVFFSGAGKVLSG